MQDENPWAKPGNSSQTKRIENKKQVVNATGLVATHAEGSSNIQAAFGGGVDRPFWVVSHERLFQAGLFKTQRLFHTATLLPNGKVLIVGGIDSNFNPTRSAELNDPATGQFTRTASLSTERYSYSATLLNNGKVLVAGGLHYVSAGQAQSIPMIRSATAKPPTPRRCATRSVTRHLRSLR